MTHTSRVSAHDKSYVRYQVFNRDGWSCRMHAEGCFGDLTVHHLRKASQGGTYTPENLITLCAYHNGWVEDHPIAAHERGMVVKSWEESKE